MHRRVIRRLHSSPSRRSGAWCALLILAFVALGASPVAAPADLADPGLDTLMKLTPAGYQRAERDRLPTGPMSAATFNAVGATAVPVRVVNGVFYGASYERSDGAVIVFLGMSSSQQTDAQAFADDVIKGTLADGQAFSTGIAGVAAVEGTSNGGRAVVIAFARKGRGFAVVSFGASARDDGSTFVKLVEGLAESTPTRPDAKTEEKLPAAAVVIAASSALAIVGIVALWRFARQRKKRSRPRSGKPANPWRRDTGIAQTLEHAVPADSPRPSPRPNPR